MKKYSHAWIAFMAIKRLDAIATSESLGANDKNRTEAKALVKWFKDYRDFVIKGAWYPDQVFKDMSTSHIVKYSPCPDSDTSSFLKLPATHSIYKMMTKKPTLSPLYNRPYKLERDSGNCVDRCEALSHSIVDNFKMLHHEEKGCPIATTGNHLAMRFFILSHYVADCHMPLHCDVRPYSDGKNIHGAIEKKWEDQVSKSYSIDRDNNRFFYDPDGYPLHLKPTSFVLDVENEVATRPYVHGWGDGNKNVWDYVRAVSQYSYLFAYHLIPEDFTKNQTMQEFTEQTEWGQKFDEYGKMIFCDAIDSIARIWLRVWIKYRDWLK